MIAAGFILVLGLVSTYVYAVPLPRVTISDNGLLGYILHYEDNQKAGLVEGHNIFPRSHGSEFKPEMDYMQSDTQGESLDAKDEVMIKSESRFGYDPYNTGFHSFLPYPPPHHGPNPGPYPPPFSQQQHPFPGYGPGKGWNNDFGQGPCHGHGCGHGPGNRNEHGHEHGYGHGPGFGHGPGHGPGHGHHGPGFGHYPPGFGHGKGHGNKYGQGPPFGGYDSSEETEEMNSTETPVLITKPTVIPPVTPPATPSVAPPVTQPLQTSAPSATPPATTVDPIYEIDVRLGQ